MIDKLEKIAHRYDELTQLLAEPAVVNDQKRYRELAREERQLSEIVGKFRAFKRTLTDIDNTQALIQSSTDHELKELAHEELEQLSTAKMQLEEELKILLIPKDPQDDKNIICEIRAGTGGNEAGLFAGDLFRMYTRFAEKKGWTIDVLSSNPQGIGGFKEIIFSLSGENVYGIMKYEGGVHRVQRVPITEASGRIHTSAASVAVLPEAEEVDIEIKLSDIRVDVFRSSGPGGQSVNTTDSAVRITHIPSGMVVTCQDEKSQHKNKAKALKVLRARLYEKALKEEQDKVTANRRSMVSSGDRSAKIRTFNFPQNRVTDHRINLSLYRLEDVLQGNLDELLEQLMLADRAEKLKEQIQ